MFLKEENYYASYEKIPKSNAHDFQNNRSREGRSKKARA